MCSLNGCVRFTNAIESCANVSLQRRNMPFERMEWATFGREEARSRIQRVIKEIVTPSSVGSLPHDFGEAKAGTMKAYQWRIMWMIHIPLAFASLWSPSSPLFVQEEEDMSPVFDNIMQLAIATTLMGKHSQSKSRVASLRESMIAHMEGLKVLFPGFGVPSYHTSIHIPDYIPVAGPTRNWWCFPFERMIGKLQRMGHNHQYGKVFAQALSIVLIFYQGNSN